MAWVIPPASPLATLVFLIVSKRVVLPWSTCPIIVTTGGLSIKSSSLSTISNSSKLTSSIVLSFFNVLLKSATKILAVSKSREALIFTSIPKAINFFINVAAGTFKAPANSATVIFSL